MTEIKIQKMKMRNAITKKAEKEEARQEPVPPDPEPPDKRDPLADMNIINLIKQTCARLLCQEFVKINVN